MQTNRCIDHLFNRPRQSLPNFLRVLSPVSDRLELGIRAIVLQHFHHGLLRMFHRSHYYFSLPFSQSLSSFYCFMNLDIFIFVPFLFCPAVLCLPGPSTVLGSLQIPAVLPNISSLSLALPSHSSLSSVCSSFALPCLSPFVHVPSLLSGLTISLPGH